MAKSYEGSENILSNVPEEIRDVVQRKMAVVQQIRDLRAQNRELREEILRSGRINSTAVAIAVECW